MQNLPVDRQKELAAPRDSAGLARRSLESAFASFTQTAGALETTYAKLRAEVGRLRYELEGKNRTLAQSLEENQRMRAYLANILESLPCGVLVFDSGMNLQTINPAARKLLDAESENSLSSAAALPQRLRPLLALLANSEFRQEQEWVIHSGQGERVLGATRATFRLTGSSESSILILRDLTEAKQLERERELSRRSQALAEVATVLAHEIRNPLGSLELFTGLLADALANQSEVQPWISHVQAGVRMLSATVNNVLHFHSQPPSELLPVELVGLVGETVDFLRPLARQNTMQIELTAPKPAVFILADRSRLQQAFFNLALNAFRAMKAGGTLSVFVSQLHDGSASMAQIAFSDQGTGIRGEDLEKIFEPGFTTRSGSPGLGLAVTRIVVEQHGGSIRVESREGKGTTFTLALPQAEPVKEDAA